MGTLGASVVRFHEQAVYLSYRQEILHGVLLEVKQWTTVQQQQTFERRGSRGLC